jgi:hypothetical protein
MNDKPKLDLALCSAVTAAGKPCTYPAVPGSDPPQCDLHGKNWLKTVDLDQKLEFYSRYLSSRENESILAQMAQPSRVRELVAARALTAHLLDELIKADEDYAAQKMLVPLILRAIKLASDLAKQLEDMQDDGDWNDVLDRLSNELDLDL